MVVRDQMNRCLWPSIVLLSALAVPVFAHADCPVPDTGIPEDAALHIDVAGMRKALAESGIGIGGFYAAETFGNPSGGFKQGATYDGVLELHLDGDLKKVGTVERPLPARQWLSDPRTQHYRRLRPQSDDREQSRGDPRNEVVRALASAEPLQRAPIRQGRSARR